MVDVSRIRGCLLAGALGDAPGAPVEFQSWAQIQADHGGAGVTGMLPPYHFTDDTQMSLFTAEAVIRTSQRGRAKGIASLNWVTWHAYLRWLATQGEPWAETGGAVMNTAEPDGWLVRQPLLHRVEAPG